ncbi:MAG: helix-turn-helix domain-containing protein [Gemmatimonadota bacterium]|nr:helix-turn-helix domain-containing protein [Gemmatimonadota bacterium]
MTQRLNFDFESFYKALSTTVTAREVSWKAVSAQTGVSQSTLSRMSKGRQPDAASLTALCAWSGLNPVDFTAAPKNDAEPVAMVSRLLRADPNLDEDSADALEAIITTAYERLKRPSSDP